MCNYLPNVKQNLKEVYNTASIKIFLDMFIFLLSFFHIHQNDSHTQTSQKYS